MATRQVKGESMQELTLAIGSAHVPLASDEQAAS
ncbi:hypothetical protein QF038_001984 [Pseudarthrobacter sp. W1I19]|nr:hypothetical protein [Pseudarthrobacter sp. W1I19]